MKIRKAFTIVEVLVATFLLSIVLALPLTELFIRTNLRVRRMQVALASEKDLLERIRVLSYDSAYLTDDGAGNDLNDMAHPDFFVDSVREKGLDIVRFYNVVDNLPSNNMKTVRVFVRWRDLRDTTSHIISAVTIKNTRW